MTSATLTAVRAPPAGVPGPAVFGAVRPAVTPRQKAAHLVALERRLHTHRVCDLQDAPYVFRMCTIDRSILPRYHQDDRGRGNAHRGFHRQAAEGAYCGTRVWPGPQAWLLRVAAAVAAHPEVLKRWQVASEMVAACAQVLSGYAQDQRTGRRCIVKPATVASCILSRRTSGTISRSSVYRCIGVLKELGFLVTIELGRMLNEVERKTAQKGGSRQRGFSTESALTVPDPGPESRALGTPSGGKATNSESGLKSLSFNSAKAKPKDAAPPRLKNKGGSRASPAWSLAVKLVNATPVLASEDPGRFVHALMRFAVSRPVWDELDLQNMIQTVAERRGKPNPLTAKGIRSPIPFIWSYLCDVDPHDDHPRLATVDPVELRCGRPECVNGWIRQVDVMLILTGRPGGLSPARHCGQCRPGAWPEPVPTVDDLLAGGQLEDEEPPF